MADTIEPARSSRARCRKCGQKIQQGDPRFGEEYDSQFSEEPSYRWYHLNCAAAKHPQRLDRALKLHDGEVPDLAALEAAIAEGKKTSSVKVFPYAESAPSGRSRCIECGEKIAKGTLRVAVEREIDTGSFVRKGAGYLHPGCCAGHLDSDEDPLQLLQENSVLGERQAAELAGALG